MTLDAEEAEVQEVLLWALTHEVGHHFYRPPLPPTSRRGSW